MGGLQLFAEMMALAADFRRIRKFWKFDQNLVGLPNRGALHHGSSFCYV